FYYALLSAWFWAVQRVYPHAIGACMVARRDVHEAIGGFDSSIKLGEDNEYILRASKQFRVGMLPLTISISARRFATEGRLRMGLKYLGALFHRVFIGEIRNDTFRYKFGHYK
ncbi:glycosyl transferase, partial [Candidatus Woesearchaeota archaeon]